MVAAWKLSAAFTPVVFVICTPTAGFFFITILIAMHISKNESPAPAITEQPKVFTFNPSNAPVRVQVINQEPWFVAKDVCDALNLTDTGKTVERLDDDEKLTRILFVSGQGRQMWLVNESGLYNLIFQSRKPEAKAFRKWVTGEVLPQIRNTGVYMVSREGRVVAHPEERERWCKAT